MTFHYRNCTTRNAVKTSSKIWIALVSIFICVKRFFWDETLNQNTQIEIRSYIVLF